MIDLDNLKDLSDGRKADEIFTLAKVISTEDLEEIAKARTSSKLQEIIVEAIQSERHVDQEQKRDPGLRQALKRVRELKAPYVEDLKRQRARQKLAAVLLEANFSEGSDPSVVRGEVDDQELKP